MKLFNVIFFLTCFCSHIFAHDYTLSTDSTSHEMKLSLSKAVAIALKNRPTLKALTFETVAQKERSREALSGYLPQVSLSNLTHIARHKKGIHSHLTLSASQLVYSFSGPLELYRIAQHDEHAAYLTEKLFQDRVRYEVETSFLTSWLLSKKKPLVRTQTHSGLTTFEQDKARYQQNLLDKNDWMRQERNYIATITDASLLEQDLAISYAHLAQRMGVMLQDPLLTWNPRSSLHLNKLAFYQRIARFYRKELKIKDHEIKRERRLERFHHKSYLPDLSIQADISRDSFFDFTQTGNAHKTTHQSIGAQVSWKLFDGFADYHRGEVAHAHMMRHTLEKQEIKNQINDEVTTSYNQAKQEIKLLKAQTPQISQAHNEFILRKQEYDLGLIDSPSFDKAQLTWEREKYLWFSQRINTELAMRSLLFSCGYPGDWS